MPAREFPNLGLKGGYDEHESGWADDQNLNLLILSVLSQGVVGEKVAAEPGSPAPGTVVILDETEPTNPNAIAVWEGPVGAETWTYIDPKQGWIMWNVDTQEYLTFDGAAWVALALGGGGSTYRVGFFFVDTPAASEPLLLHVFTKAATFADDWAGAYAKTGTNPTATFALDVQKNGASVGSVSISTVGVATFSTTGGAVSFNPGDSMEIISPVTPDATVARVAITFEGTI